MTQKSLLTPKINPMLPVAASTHKVPRLPILIDHTRADREAVQDFNGRPLHTVLDRDAYDSKLLRIFTSQEKTEEYCRHIATTPNTSWGARSQRRPKQNTLSALSGQTYVIGSIELYEHINFGGHMWRMLDSDTVVPDFTQLKAGGFLWWGQVNANDRVSSLDCGTSFTNLVLYEHSYLGGSALWLPGNCWVTSLVDCGWNDRASSLMLISLSPPKAPGQPI